MWCAGPVTRAMRKIVHFQNVCWYDLPNFYPCHEVGGDDKIKALV